MMAEWMFVEKLSLTLWKQEKEVFLFFFQFYEKKKHNLSVILCFHRIMVNAFHPDTAGKPSYSFDKVTLSHLHA